MDNKMLHDRFRRQLTVVHALTVLTVSVFEIVGYIVLILSGIERFAVDNAYLWYGVAAPIAINTAAHFTARAIVKNPRVKRTTKNRSIITAALVTSFVVAVIHKEYIVTSCAFIFPMILSATFNDKKLLHTSFAFSVLILVCVGAAFRLDGNITLTTALNLFILLGFALISYLCSLISINFSAQNYTTIESQAEQNDRLMEDVLRDQMTGLYHHHSFVTHLDECLAAADPAVPITLVMLDIDDFKTVNDTYGHDCGDEVLLCMAEIIKPYDDDDKIRAYRYGGEEFALLFEGVTADEAHTAICDLLNTFRARRFTFTDRTLTFSAGIAAYTQGWSSDDFFEHADQALYRAKHEGKNRILRSE